MGRLQDNINSLRNSLKDIRTSLNSKGAGIVEGDDLDTWDNKINSMPNVQTSVGSYGSSYIPTWLRVVDKYEVPTIDNNGNALNPYFLDYTTTTYNVYLASQMFGIAKEFTIPEYFSRQLLGNNVQFQNVDNANLEVLNHNGSVSIINPSGNTWHKPEFIYFGKIKRFRVLNLNKITTIEGLTFTINSNEAQEYPKITINCKKVTSITTNSTGSRNLLGDATSGYYREIDWNFPELLTITMGSSSYNSLFANSTGIINMPKLKSITGNANWYKHNTADKYYTMKCPVLETMSNTYFGSQGAGGIKLYIGPNLSSAVAAIGNAEIHIPDGDSTTKTTLDGLGISYTQDYTP